jgi:hypothetical protein
MEAGWIEWAVAEWTEWEEVEWIGRVGVGWIGWPEVGWTDSEEVEWKGLEEANLCVKMIGWNCPVVVVALDSPDVVRVASAVPALAR